MGDKIRQMKAETDAMSTGGGKSTAMTSYRAAKKEKTKEQLDAEARQKAAASKTSAADVAKQKQAADAQYSQGSADAKKKKLTAIDIVMGRR